MGANRSETDTIVGLFCREIGRSAKKEEKNKPLMAGPGFAGASSANHGKEHWKVHMAAETDWMIKSDFLPLASLGTL